MLWRHRCLVRAWSAAGLVSGLMFIGASIATAQTQKPEAAPVVTAAISDPEPSSAPVDVATETVDLLKASKTGDLGVVARGQGQDRVHLTIKNRSTRRLNVIVPPGLVAASSVAQGRGGGAGGGGLQNMGLGAATNREGAFGEFQVGRGPVGLRSIPATDESRSRQVTVPVGETIDLSIPAVCLNFGLQAPTPRDTFTLQDVDDYSADPRVRKALRSLATLGTSHGVAQAAMWRVCNDLSFEAMAAQTGKVINLQEIALATRFVEALDASNSSSSDLVDGAALSESRVFVQVRGEGKSAADAKRLGGQLAGARLMGLPIQLVESEELPASSAPALALTVTLTASKTGDTLGRIAVSSRAENNAWIPLGKVVFQNTSAVSALDGAMLSRMIDRAVASAFVTVKPARRTVGMTTLKVENRLPFTVVNLVVKAGASLGSPSVTFEGVGAGPSRSVLLPIQAATASLVEHVELNGL
jgi:hypothetical protein